MLVMDVGFPIGLGLIIVIDVGVGDWFVVDACDGCGVSDWFGVDACEEYRVG